VFRPRALILHLVLFRARLGLESGQQEHGIARMVPASGIQERLPIGLYLFDNRDPVLAACIFAIQHLQDLRDRGEMGLQQDHQGDLRL
jgi:hypothetical protein